MKKEKKKVIGTVDLEDDSEYYIEVIDEKALEKCPELRGKKLGPLYRCEPIYYEEPKKKKDEANERNRN